MRYLILNGQAKEDAVIDSTFAKKLDQLKVRLEEKGHSVTYVELNAMEINECIGCYNCWLKTPGLCIWKDDMTSIMEELVKSDYVMISSPVKMAFISSLAKRIKDRQLPLVHPYLKMNADRMGHIMRYENQPRQVLLLDTETNTEHISNIYGNKANDSRSIYYMTEKMEDLIYELTAN